MTPYEHSIDIEIRKELDACDPVKQRFIRHAFVSRSAGQDRARRLPREIVLVCDLFQSYNPPRFVHPSKLPFDELSSELWPMIDEWKSERRLRRVLE